ncbi:TonB-dependent receptor [Christiangramia echinicola]|uniref:Outer membrane receptor proteins, mostly Fe transport n=1 Tax=Christiangramia echinicola TaxID=279359 RepID=A0A1H1NBT0_9FLAO|nr:TonB-dependent receptor [Christiangramia echinicola]SDR95809.1 Outer membrane receptor proteins, mostly Fe transport [Christiangramia echinicola]
MKRLPLLIFFLISICSAQNKSFKGQVYDEKDNPLENVAIYSKSSGFHTHTNANGEFLLKNVLAGEVLKITNLGFKTIEHTITPDDFTREIIFELEETTMNLNQIVINGERDVLSAITRVDLKINPVKSSQEILRKVPGLIIGQHAGGGKAEQIFLRGFDIDHGTDISLSVDGMPVNMVSHAHGQGYSDLHFLIPETIKNIEFGMGPYHPDHGNFATAGFVNFKTVDKLEQNMVSMELGQFNSKRLVGMFNVLDKDYSNAYIASSLNLFDGPFESPQNFNRFNIMGKYNYKVPGDEELNLTISHFQSKWDASGQIPERAVADGSISRFGAIDDTEGGNTSRTNILVNHTRNLTDAKKLKTRAFYFHYDFELYSNFTFFLEDPVNADQIKQKEDRNILGAETVFEYRGDNLPLEMDYSAGIGFRYDDSNLNELSRTKNRDELLERLANGNVDETNLYGFFNTGFDFGKLQVNPGLRLDYFNFAYENLITETYDNKSENKLFLSPKLNFNYNASNSIQLYLKSGIGFHSNDSRVVVARDGEEILPAAYGTDLGLIYKPGSKWILNTAAWLLYLDQEFVYVGDAAIVEPSGKTRRLGLDLGARYQATDWLYLYSDLNYTYARSTEEASDEDYIPLAPEFTSTGGLAIENLSGFSGAISYRYINDRPANEDFSITADGYLVTDLNLNYRINNLQFGIIIENLFDTKWNETQFATESRLRSELNPVEEIHFTPGTPFFLRGKVSVYF